MDHDRVRIRLGQATDRSVTSVRRTIIYYPEDSVRGLVRRLLHHLADQTAERVNARTGFAPSHDIAPSHIPGSQVLQSSASFVFKFDAAVYGAEALSGR